MGEKEKIEGWTYVIVCDPVRMNICLDCRVKNREWISSRPFSPGMPQMTVCLTLPREKGKKYEVQAIHVDDLNETAKKNGFLVAMVDGDGNIIR